LPKDTGILGIYKPTNSDKLVLPPFAIRFDEKGQLAVTDSTDATTFVYYDANNDDIINISTGNGKDRANPYPDGTEYIIDEWAPKQSTANTGNGATESYKLPFEKLEAVVGVIIFSKRELREDGGVFPGILTFTSNSTNSGCGFDSNNIALGCATLQDWLERHGEVLFFSRYTGALLKHK
ncbi:MAG: hypothetical protein JKX85_05990, partial [Phycisphaeraceae bacterium]|nr:hypothetical protein [Phycisphaeraceae bacterium]